ncbi:mannosyl transferase [Colletotrichum plurivorum]|uniref:Mannosyl transferase n=1 Tax=Colletotrichum plurivorum TaxID=2175906 RepID=A0A8H6NB97_9PEZI|nr:mannosyl transferase [Colletotrichum plurivorum]
MAILRIDSLTPEAWKLLLGLFVLLSAAALSRSVGLLRSRKPSPSSRNDSKTGSHGKAAKDELYVMPTPTPYPDWSIETTKPLPYRAFRYGPKYHVTMGLRTVQPEDWIELDNHYPKYHADKAARIRDRGVKCVATQPEAYPAALELLDELARYLPARYPTLFRRTAVGIDNLWSGESFDLTQTPLAEDPMAIAARLVQDDLAIMLERPDGSYHLLAGAICLAGFWRLGDKLGMSLDEIHTSGDVPHYRERLRGGMNGFFRRLRCDQVYGRNNYFIQVDDALPWSWSIGGEDDPTTGWGTAEKDRAVEHHHFRSERQSLRRLPRTKAVVFTIRTYFHPVTELAAEDYVPGRLASAIRSWDDTVANYKGREMYGKVLLEYLDREHQKQLDRGLDLEEEDEVRKYPW